MGLEREKVKVYCSSRRNPVSWLLFSESPSALSCYPDVKKVRINREEGVGFRIHSTDPPSHGVTPSLPDVFPTPRNDQEQAFLSGLLKGWSPAGDIRKVTECWKTLFRDPGTANVNTQQADHVLFSVCTFSFNMELFKKASNRFMKRCSILLIIEKWK